jgi:sporulation protein YlmC with PRC-barrel domain
MKRISLLALAGLCGLLLVAASSARDDTKKADGKAQGPSLYRAAGVRGLKVFNNKSEEIGKIADLAISMNDGHIVYAAMSHGGVAGVGDKLFAVPWNALKIQDTDKSTWFVLDVDKSRLDSAAGFNEVKWPTEADRTFAPANKNGDKPGEALRDAKDKIKETARDAKDALTGAEIQRTSALIGTKVKNGTGEDLGKVSDLVFEQRDGSLLYAVLAHGGVAGVGAKMFAVPWNTMKLDSLTLKPSDRVFVLNVQKNTLEQSAGFSKDNWPREADSNLFKAEKR